MDHKELLNALYTKYGEDKVTQAMEIILKLYGKTISELEEMKKATDSPNILKTINLVIQSKLYTENKDLDGKIEKL